MTNDSLIDTSTPSAAVRRWRVVLMVVGIGLLVVGGLVLLADVSPKRYLGILIWFGGALIIHDGIVAPIVFAIGLVLRRANRRIPFGVIVILQVALVLGAIMTGIVVPEILKKSIGTANETLLPLNYATNLAVFYGVLLVVTAAAIGIFLRVIARRERASQALLPH